MEKTARPLAVGVRGVTGAVVPMLFRQMPAGIQTLAAGAVTVVLRKMVIGVAPLPVPVDMPPPPLVLAETQVVVVEEWEVAPQGLMLLVLFVVIKEPAHPVRPVWLTPAHVLLLPVETF